MNCLQSYYILAKLEKLNLPSYQDKVIPKRLNFISNNSSLYNSFLVVISPLLYTSKCIIARDLEHGSSKWKKSTSPTVDQAFMHHFIRIISKFGVVQ